MLAASLSIRTLQALDDESQSALHSLSPYLYHRSVQKAADLSSVFASLTYCWHAVTTALTRPPLLHFLQLKAVQRERDELQDICDAGTAHMLVGYYHLAWLHHGFALLINMQG